MLTVTQVRKMLKDKVKKAGGLAAAADQAGICEVTYLSQQIAGSRNVGKAALKWLGLVEVKQPSLYEAE
jgi:hypothetical protein